MPVVFIDAELGAAVLPKAALDVVFCVAVYQAAFGVYAVFSEVVSVTEVEIEIVAFFGFQVCFSCFSPSPVTCIFPQKWFIFS